MILINIDVKIQKNRLGESHFLKKDLSLRGKCWLKIQNIKEGNTQ